MWKIDGTNNKDTFPDILGGAISVPIGPAFLRTRPTAGFKERRNPFKNGLFWSKEVKPGKMPSVHILHKIPDLPLILMYQNTINIEWSFFLHVQKIGDSEGREHRPQTRLCLAAHGKERPWLNPSPGADFPPEVWLVRKELHFWKRIPDT